MATTKALFKRHYSEFISQLSPGLDAETILVQSIIYAACIVSESIRIEGDLLEAEIKVPEGIKKP